MKYAKTRTESMEAPQACWRRYVYLFPLRGSSTHGEARRCFPDLPIPGRGAQLVPEAPELAAAAPDVEAANVNE